MQCPIQSSDNSGILLDYCARRLDAGTLALLEQHIAVCPECTRFAEAQRQVWSALDGWDAAQVSEEFDARLYARIEVQGRGGWLTRVFGDALLWKPAVPFAAACGAVALAVLLNTPGSAPVVEPDVQVRTRIEAAIEPEQLERAIEDVEMLRQFSIPPQTL